MPSIQKKVNCFIGIDPGKNGGLVAIFEMGEVVYEPMLATDAEVLSWLREFGPETIACIEKVSGYIGAKHPGSSMFNFGAGYGGLKMALAATEIPFEEVTPQAWQKSMQCRTGGDKTVSLRKAQQLYPKLPLWKTPRSKGKQLAIADALLIATYCMRKYKGTL